MLSLTLLLLFSTVGDPATAEPARCPPVADTDHEIAPGTYTVLVVEPSYLVPRYRAEDLLAAEWERDQLAEALREAEQRECESCSEMSETPWGLIVGVSLGALAIGFGVGAVVGLTAR